jgi:hypothetical protein
VGEIRPHCYGVVILRVKRWKLNAGRIVVTVRIELAFRCWTPHFHT